MSRAIGHVGVRGQRWATQRRRAPREDATAASVGWGYLGSAAAWHLKLYLVLTHAYYLILLSIAVSGLLSYPLIGSSATSPKLPSIDETFAVHSWAAIGA